MRNWHYLHAGRAVGWPRQSIALSCVCSAGAVANGQRISRPTRLLGWAAVLWRGEQGRAEQVRTADGITAAQWWHWLLAVLRRGECTWVWQLGACHGLTSLGFWDSLSRRDWSLCGADPWRRPAPTSNGQPGRGGLCVVSDPPTIVLTRCRGSVGSVRWLDARNMGVRGWADLSCTGSRDTEAEPGGTAGLLPARAVAARRAASLAAWLQCWYDTVRELDLGGLRSTAASQSWHGWLHRYNTEIVEAHNDQGRLAAEIAALYGGRCEVRRRDVAHANVYQLDARAYYPSLASGAPLPIRVCRGYGGPVGSLHAAHANGLLVIAKGRVWTDRPVMPRRAGGTVGFPVGTWVGTYCWPEWELLTSAGGECRIYQWWAYEPGRPFTRYYDRLWAARLAAKMTGRSGHELAIKLLMNSLIGRCAAELHYWADRPDEFHPDPWAQWYARDDDTGECVRWRTVAGYVQRETVEGYHPEAVPAVAAWIYSLGRVQLWRWMDIAGEDNVLYVDTDSLWVTEAGYRNLAGHLSDVPDLLGGLRLVKRHPWARFYGARHYETPDGIVAAGVPQNAAIRTDGGWTYWAPESLSQAVQARHQPLERLLRYNVSDRSTYANGRVGVGGRVFTEEVYDGKETDEIR